MGSENRSWQGPLPGTGEGGISHKGHREHLGDGLVSVLTGFLFVFVFVLFLWALHHCVSLLEVVTLHMKRTCFITNDTAQ